MIWKRQQQCSVSHQQIAKRQSTEATYSVTIDAVKTIIVSTKRASASIKIYSRKKIISPKY